jgi:hypothetical protein
MFGLKVDYRGPADLVLTLCFRKDGNCEESELVWKCDESLMIVQENLPIRAGFGRMDSPMVRMISVSA